MPDSRKAFFDSNVLLYLAAGDDERADRVEEIIEDGSTISVQVPNEIANVARRKWKMPWSDANALMVRLREMFEVIPLTEQVHLDGMRIAERHRLSVYDGFIIAAAVVSGCEILYSEDMHHGLVVDGRVTVVNPFRD
jgi:predicted nucleic acid-binding protein